MIRFFKKFIRKDLNKNTIIFPFSFDIKEIKFKNEQDFEKKMKELKNDKYFSEIDKILARKDIIDTTIDSIAVSYEFYVREEISDEQKKEFKLKREKPRPKVHRILTNDEQIDKIINLKIEREKINKKKKKKKKN